METSSISELDIFPKLQSSIPSANNIVKKNLYFNKAW